MKQNPYEPPQHTSGPPRQSTAGMVWVEVDRRWVDRVRSPMFMVVAAFTGVSISFAPLTLLFLDHIPVPSVYRWIIAGICLTMIYVIPGWYMRLAGEVLRQLHAKRTWIRALRVITIRCTRSRGPRGFFCLQVDRRGPVIVDVITFHARSGWRDARSVQYQTRDMLVQGDSSLARCPFWFVTCSPVIDINAEMLDMQSADATTAGCNR